jgi:hypothetical protein
MKLDELKDALAGQERPARKAPELVIWIPPSGVVVECPASFDIVQAGAAAGRLAARHPGATVAVYRLEGTAVAPIVEPPFTPSVDEPFLLAERQADADHGGDDEP